MKYPFSNLPRFPFGSPAKARMSHSFLKHIVLPIIASVVILCAEAVSAETVTIQAEVKLDGHEPASVVVYLAAEGPTTPPRIEPMEYQGNGLYSKTVDFVSENVYTVEVRTESECDPCQEYHPCVGWFEGMSDQVDLAKTIWMLQVLAGVR